jgi:hypothetical protein
MLGFGKKKQRRNESLPESVPAKDDATSQDKAAAAKGKQSPAVSAAASKAAAQPKKRRFSIKKLLISLVIFGLLSGGGFAGYTFFFKETGSPGRQFQETAMPHLTLPKEMLRFSFDQFPRLYDAFVQFEKEIALFEKEIARIEAISAKYPDQEKIALRQKKIWEKGKNTLLKEFAKLEKPVKETYVLYQVNPRLGREQIKASADDLAARASEAIAAAQQLSAEIKAMSPPRPLRA